PRRGGPSAGPAAPCAGPPPARPAGGGGPAGAGAVGRLGGEVRRDGSKLPPARAGGGGRDPVRADIFYEGDIIDLRPERRRDHPEELAEDRLRGRARYRYRQPRSSRPSV